MAELPIEDLDLDFGYVVGYIFNVAPDSEADLDNLPDALGARGTVTFTPVTQLLRKDYLPSPGPILSFLLNRPVVATLYEAPDEGTPLMTPGALIDQAGNPGVKLPVGQYRVEFRLDFGSIPAFNVEILDSYTEANPLNLANATPYTPPSQAPVNVIVVPPNGGSRDTLQIVNGELQWTSVVRDAADDALTAANNASSAVAVAEAALDDQIVDGEVVGGELILKTRDSTEINAGSVVDSEAMRVMNYGTDADAPRPAAPYVYWVGSSDVEPVNAIDGDLRMGV